MSRSDAKYCINFLNVGHNMKDGDNVVVDVQYHACPQHRIKFGLSLGKSVTWWKGIILYQKGNKNYFEPLLELQDQQCPKVIEIDYHLLRNHDLVLCKAKAFGVHSPLYCIADAEYALQPGNCYTFTWIRD